MERILPLAFLGHFGHENPWRAGSFTKQMRLRTAPEYAPEITLNAQGFRNAPGERRISLLAPPGSYTVKLTVDGKDYTQPLKVLKDPHLNGTEGDIQVQTRLMSSLSGTMNNLVDAVNEIRVAAGAGPAVEIGVGDGAGAGSCRGGSVERQAGGD
jgi:hypothetical protein